MINIDPADARAITWSLFYQAFTSMFKESERALSPAGVSGPQAFALACLKYGEQPVIPSRLAGFLAQESQSLTGLIDRMEQHGWVRRVRDLPDRRSLRLQLTQAGEEKLEEAQREGRRAANTLFGALSDEELNTLGTLLERLRMASLERLGLNPDASRTWNEFALQRDGAGEASFS
jgi:DNA-binding MarR family transcriptional regulator